MRFLLFAVSICFPLMFIELTDEFADGQFEIYFYSTVGIVAEILFICFCVSEFVKHHMQEAKIERQRIEKEHRELMEVLYNSFRSRFSRDFEDFKTFEEEFTRRAKNAKGGSENHTAGTA